MIENIVVRECKNARLEALNPEASGGTIQDARDGI
jgi:hypothetical protein